MSFKKRKTSYRKSVTSTTLDDYPIPEEGESLARISNPRGGNLFEVELPNGTKRLALLPTKFNKLIWMKRGDYVIITLPEIDTTASSNKQHSVESVIEHILMKDQVNHIKKENLWPKEWEETPVEPKKVDSPAEDLSESDDSDFGFEANPNRRRFYIESDDEEEDSD